MSLKSDAFPASAAFDVIAASLSSDAAKQNAIKQANGVFTFTLKNGSGAVESWHIDLKQTGSVGKGAPEKSDVTLALSEDDFAKLVEGKVQPQRLFMTGKLKIRGDIMKATKVEVLFAGARQEKAKL